MLIPNQYFEIKITKANLEHYTQLGYNVDLKNIINVPAEHLTKGSHQLVKSKCDFCGTDIPEKEYKTYLINHTYCLDSCKKCTNEKAKITLCNKYGVLNAMDIPGVKEKIKLTFVEKYGVHYSQTKEFKEKFKNTCLERYGVEFPSQLEEIKDKIKDTNLNKYGSVCPLGNKEIWNKTKVSLFEKYGVENVSQIQKVKEKKIKKSLEKYGFENPSSSKEVRKKVKQTFLERYGVENALQVPEIRQKVIQTMKSNGTVPTSSQQIIIFEMIKKQYDNCILNHPEDKACFDIALFIDNIKIDIEYDGWYWHQDKQKDRRRDEHFKSKGWKILRIRSGHLLPAEEQLFEAINKLIKTNYKYTEIILDDWKEGEESA